VTARVLLTGATSGIGALVAQQLRDRGDALVLVARDVGRLAGDFPDAELVELDLGSFDPDAVRIEGELQGVVHSAGVVDVAPVADSDAASLRRTVEINLVAPMLLTRAVLEAVRRGHGTHVFVNSGSGLNANATWASYNASKFGLRGFADALRQEEREHGVRVSSVYPGRTATPMQEQVHRQEGADYDADQWIRPETVATEIVRLIDLAPDATFPDLTIRPA
jgi:short-subunit dehydrogenase